MIAQFVSERELHPEVKRELTYIEKMIIGGGNVYRGFGTNLIFSEGKKVSIAGDEKDIRKVKKELTDLFKTKLTPIGN